MINPQTDVQTESIPSAVNHILPVLQHNRERAEARSGSAARGETLNADVLAKSTMGAYLDAVERGNSRLEQAARDMAETASTQLMLKAHELLRRHSGPRRVKVRGQWIMVDPSQWRRRTAVSTHTGESMANKREQLTGNMTILEMQGKAMEHGLSTPQHMYNTITDILQLMNKHDPTRYFFDPQSPEGMESMQKVAKSKAEAKARADELANAQVQSANNEVERRAIKDQKDASIRLLEMRQKQSHHDDQLSLDQEELEQKYEVEIAKWGASGERKTAASR